MIKLPAKPKILIARGDMLGDLVTATALIQPLLTRFPDAQLWMLCRPHIVETLSANPALAGAIADPMGYADTHNSPTYIELKRTLAAHQFDAVIHCWEHPRYARMTRSLGIPVRIGHAIGLRNRFYNTHTVALDYRDYHRHKVEMNAALLTPLGISTPDLRLDLTLPDTTSRAVLKRYQLRDRGYRVMHTDAGAATKCLVGPEWTALLSALLALDDRPLVLLGHHLANTTQDIVAWIEQQPRIINLVAKTSLIESCGVIRYAKSFIGPDSGLSHVAAAYQIPSVVFYRNRTQNVFHWGPWRCPHIIIKQQNNCQDDCQPITCQVACNRTVLDAQLVTDAVLALENPRGDWAKTQASDGTQAGQSHYWDTIGHQRAAPPNALIAAQQRYPGQPIIPLPAHGIVEIKNQLVTHNINQIITRHPTWQLQIARIWASNIIHFYPTIDQH